MNKLIIRQDWYYWFFFPIASDVTMAQRCAEQVSFVRQLGSD